MSPEEVVEEDNGYDDEGFEEYSDEFDGDDDEGPSSTPPRAVAASSTVRGGEVSRNGGGGGGFGSAGGLRPTSSRVVSPSLKVRESEDIQTPDDKVGVSCDLRVSLSMLRPVSLNHWLLLHCILLLFIMSCIGVHAKPSF